MLHLKKISVFNENYSYGSFIKNRRVIHRVTTSGTMSADERQRVITAGARNGDH